MSRVPDPTRERIEVVYDIDPENTSLFPLGTGVTITVVPGEKVPHRLAVISSISAADTERVLMSALAAVAKTWDTGVFEANGDDPVTRDQRMTDRTWKPWQ